MLNENLLWWPLLRWLPAPSRPPLLCSWVPGLDSVKLMSQEAVSGPPVSGASGRHSRDTGQWEAGKN